MNTSKSALLYFALVCVLAGCSDVPSNPEKNPSEKPIDARKFGVITTDSLVGLLLYNAGLHIRDDVGPTYASSVQAFFAGPDSLKDVTSASVNSESLVRLFEGQYVIDEPTVPTSSPYSLNWSATGFAGSSFSNTFNMATPMSPTNLGYCDTIDKSAGYSVTYSGSASGMVTVSIVFDEPRSALEVHADSTSYGGYLTKTVSDNGTISLTPTDLAGLKPHRVYTLLFEHDLYQSTNYVGAKVGHYSSYTVSVPFVLVP